MEIYTINKLRWISRIICIVFLAVGMIGLVKTGYSWFYTLWYTDANWWDPYTDTIPTIIMLFSFSQAAVWGVISYILTYLYKQH